MGKYTCTVRATTNSSANTEDTAIDLDMPAGQACKIYRIRIVCQTAALDNQFRAKIARKSAIGSGSTGGTELKMDPLIAPATAVATIKNGTTAYGAGTITETLDDAIQFNSRGNWEWVARDEEDMYVSDSGGIIGVNIFNSAASIAFAVTIWWTE
ncbi:MAG TPA: hypothetical protein VL854_06815 [Nitrososphaeraceae archaeon]|jgi:hypothetical protein|nr:hypothetical protein [Nitrososphaeraceae archaeon]